MGRQNRRRTCDGDFMQTQKKSFYLKDGILTYCDASDGAVHEFSYKKLTEHVTGIQGPAGEVMYVVNGDERSLLIDATAGIGDCGQLAELFARHPYEILLTHGHVDHCGGIYCFDDRRVKIRLNEKDRTPKPGLKRTVLETGRSIETRLWFVSPVCGWAARADFTEDRDLHHLHGLADGQRFDLGNYEADAVKLAGHTPGSMGILLKEDGLLITGDAASTLTYLFLEHSLTVEQYVQNLKRIYKRRNEYKNGILLSHGRMEPRSYAMLKELITIGETVLLRYDRGMLPYYPEEKKLHISTSSGEYEACQAGSPHRETGRAYLLYRQDRVR